jgi:ABC-type multidrug transport system fused ATPase/permease subunit
MSLLRTQEELSSMAGQSYAWSSKYLPSLQFCCGTIPAPYLHGTAEYGKCPRIAMPADEEIAEKSVQANSSDDGLRVLDLTRSFGHFTTAENLTLGVKRGQVFALLGSNGAGKSTTISLIRGDIQPSNKGEISSSRTLKSTDIKHKPDHISAYARNMMQ